MERTIAEIDVLVHPDFHQLYCARGGGVDAKQADLHQAWDARIEGQAGSENWALFYLPSWNLIKPQCRGEHQDLTRVERYSKLLGDRLVIFQEYRLPKAHQIQAKLESQGLSLGHDIIATFYGEYLDLCVPAVADHFHQVIDSVRLTITIDQRLCRTSSS